MSFLRGFQNPKLYKGVLMVKKDVEQKDKLPEQTKKRF